MFILCIVAIGIGICLSIYGMKRPTVIKYSYSWNAWVIPIFYSFVFFIFIFVVEYMLSVIFINNVEMSSFLIKLVIKIIENGLLIPFFSGLLSKFFGITVEKLDLDYSEYYNDKIAKICFSILVSVGSIAFMYIMYLTGEENDYFVNRVLMWFLTVVGTWIGWGFGCKGRIERENQKRKNISKIIDKRKIFKFWVPIIWPLIMCILILACCCFFNENTLLQIEKYLIIFAAVFIISGLTTLYIGKRIINPSEKKSINDFYTLLKNYKNGKIIKRHFGWNKYWIENGVLKIEAISISYPGHENDKEFCELFNKIDDHKVNIEKYDDIIEFLRNRNSAQKNYIKKGFEDCLDNMRKKQLN